MKKTIGLALAATLLASGALAGGVSNVAGTLDTTIVDPAAALYPHFICASGCSGGGGGGGGVVTEVAGGFVDLTTIIASLSTLNTTDNGLFKAGQSIGNTAFAISGSLPAFAATPTVNIGTAPTIGVTGTFYQATQPVSGTVSVSALPAGANTIGAVNVKPTTGGGLSIQRFFSTSATTGVIKASGGQIFSYDLMNTAASTRYFHLYLSTTAPTLGTSVPYFSVAIAAGAKAAVSSDIGWAYGVGMAYAITTDDASAPAAAASAGDVVGFVGFD